MTKSLDPFRFLLIAMSGWMNQQQMELIDYLREENRVLREQLGQRRLRFNDDQRRRLAVRAKGLGSKLLREVATIVTPETLLAWHRWLIAKKYDGSANGDAADRENPRRLGPGTYAPPLERGSDAHFLRRCRLVSRSEIRCLLNNERRHQCHGERWKPFSHGGRRAISRRQRISPAHRMVA